jgi:hypothetical protein
MLYKGLIVMLTGNTYLNSMFDAFITKMSKPGIRDLVIDLSKQKHR